MSQQIIKSECVQLKEKSGVDPAVSDQQSARVLTQAIEDDPALSSVAKGIHVTVHGDVVTLDGTVSTEQQMNLATNTAKAVGVDDKVINHLGLVKKLATKVNDGAADKRES